MILFRSESCDDGNKMSQDGCDSECHVEEDYQCQGMVMRKGERNLHIQESSSLFSVNGEGMTILVAC